MRGVEITSKPATQERISDLRKAIGGSCPMCDEGAILERREQFPKDYLALLLLHARLRRYSNVRIAEVFGILKQSNAHARNPRKERSRVSMSGKRKVDILLASLGMVLCKDHQAEIFKARLPREVVKKKVLKSEKPSTHDVAVAEKGIVEGPPDPEKILDDLEKALKDYPYVLEELFIEMQRRRSKS